MLIGSDDGAFVADAYPAVFAEHALDAPVERIEGASHLGLVAPPRRRPRSSTWLGALASAARRMDPGATGGAAAAMR